MIPTTDQKGENLGHPVLTQLQQIQTAERENVAETHTGRAIPNVESWQRRGL